MSPDPPFGRRASGLLAAGLLLLPLVYAPGLDASGLLPKRMVVYAVGLGLSLVWLQATRSGASGWPRTPLALPAGLYLLVNFLSLAWAVNPFAGLVQGVQLLELGLIFLAVVALLRLSDVLLLARAAALGGLLVSTIGVAQYLGLGFEHIPSVGLPSGTFAFRNLAAAYLVGAAPLAFLAFFLEPRPLLRLLWAAAGAAMVLFLVYTRTRAAWAGFAGALLVSGALVGAVRPLREALGSAFRKAWAPPLLRWGLPLCALVLVGATALPDHTPRSALQRFDEQKSTAEAAVASVFSAGSDRGREVMWKYTWEMIEDHPLLGVGLHNWEFLYPRYDHGGPGGKITEASEPVRPHNDFLWIWSELGTVGLAVYLYLLFAAARAALAGFRSKSPETRLVALAAAFGLVALLGDSLFSFPKEQPASAALFWVYLALLGGVVGRAARPARAPTWWLPAFGCLLSIGALHLAWRHVRFDRGVRYARAFAEAGAWDQAASEISRALRNGTFDHRARFLLGRYLQRAGHYEQAVAAYREALEFHPNYVHTYHDLGGAYAALGAWGPAISAYRKALALRPGYLQARINLGNAYLRTGRMDEAARTFRRAVAGHPESADAHGSLGALDLQQGNLDAALAELREAVRLRPNYPQAWNNLAYAYEKKGDLSRAVDAYETLLRRWKGSLAYARTVRLHLRDLRARLNAKKQPVEQKPIDR